MDKNQNPIVVVKAAKHIPKQVQVQETVNFFLFMVEKGIKLCDEHGTGKISVIYDRTGFTKKNFDRSLFGLFRKLLGILQDNYAERLDKLFLINPNWLFKVIYKIVSPFLSKKTKEKIVLIKKLDTLKQYIDAS